MAETTRSQKFTIASHPHYNPDMAPSDFWFVTEKELRKGQKCSWGVEVEAVVRKCIKDNF